ncbi:MULTISPECIES: tyrosine recombinase XerC [unclassified Streptomyces]|uniref:site-specific integrase n=1 Tax=unclassified Streptomyces TaxID=2593676 RepID=UPI00381B50FA
MDDLIKKVVLKNGAVRYRFVIDVGSVPKKDKGTGEVLLNQATDEPVMQRKQLTVTRDKLKDAENELSRIRHQQNAGTYIVPSKMTLAEWLDEWLGRKARDVEPTTIRTYRMALVHVYDKLGGIRLQALTEDQIQVFVDDLVATGRRKGGPAGTRLAVSTTEGILTRLREALGRAVVRKLIPSSPAQYVKVSLNDKKTDRRERKPAKPWNVDEVQQFIKGIESDRLHAPLLLSLMGLRPAEVVGMRWSDIDLKSATLETANTRTMIGNKTVLEKDTKTEAGERALPLPSRAAEALRKFRALQARERLAAGEGYTDTGYVVVDELGMPRNTRHLREHAYRLMEKLGLRKVRLYDARHSCLTYLAVNGVSDVILAAWAGHTVGAFTKKKYVHPDVEDLRPAATAWDSFHGGDPKPPV